MERRGLFRPHVRTAEKSTSGSWESQMERDRDGERTRLKELVLVLLTTEDDARAATARPSDSESSDVTVNGPPALLNVRLWTLCNLEIHG